MQHDIDIKRTDSQSQIYILYIIKLRPAIQIRWHINENTIQQGKKYKYKAAMFAMSDTSQMI